MELGAGAPIWRPLTSGMIIGEMGCVLPSCKNKDSAMQRYLMMIDIEYSWIIISDVYPNNPLSDICGIEHLTESTTKIGCGKC